MTTQANNTKQPVTFVKLIPVFILYFVWGSTYLAIRIVVREGSGFPPFTAASTRFLTAAILILLWGLLTRKQMKPNREELLTMVMAGVLMPMFGNGLVNFAEQRADSGMAALFVAAVPIWAILIEGLSCGRRSDVIVILSVSSPRASIKPHAAAAATIRRITMKDGLAGRTIR